MLKLPPYSRRRLLGAGAVSLIGGPAIAQSALGGAPAGQPGAGTGSNAPIQVSGAQNAPIPIA
ncbi:MAG TPA: hypothetical protein VEQ16_01680, partial [Acidocella sp.]|nr:hypothetical protein [Acidocella sp.]